MKQQTTGLNAVPLVDTDGLGGQELIVKVDPNPIQGPDTTPDQTQLYSLIELVKQTNDLLGQMLDRLNTLQ